MSSEPREIPPEAVAVAAKALHDEYFAETEVPVRDAESCTLCPIRARKTLDAALSFLASSPEGRAWLARQAFDRNQLRGLQNAVSFAGYDYFGHDDPAFVNDLLAVLAAALELRGDGNE